MLYVPSKGENIILTEVVGVYVVMVGVLVEGTYRDVV